MNLEQGRVDARHRKALVRLLCRMIALARQSLEGNMLQGARACSG